MRAKTAWIGILALAISAGAGVARAQDTLDTQNAQDQSADNAVTQGDLAQMQDATLIEPLSSSEKFVASPVDSLNQVAADMRSFNRGAIVLRGDATVPDGVVHIKNVCRWSQEDAAIFAPVADLAITHIPDGRTFATVTLDQVRDTLDAAKMNLAMISFDGAITCAVNRADDQAVEQASLDQWINSQQAAPAADVQTPAAPPVIAAPTSDRAAAPLRSLRTILTDDLCGRLQIDPDNMQLDFNSSDEKVLNLAEPYFQFQVTPRRVRTLGDVAWEVDVSSRGRHQKISIEANARQWLTEAIVLNPIAYQQVIRDQDVQEKRILTDELISPLPLVKARAVDQQAARALKPGMVITPEMVDPVLLVRPNQLVTVNIRRGNVQITAVAKAIDGGAYGQTIRARNDVDPTKFFEVTVTGPQEGAVSSAANDNDMSTAAANPSSP